MHPHCRVHWAISAFQDNQNNLKAATPTCFQLITLALTRTDIRHRHHGGMSKKNTATDRVANYCHHNNTTTRSYYCKKSLHMPHFTVIKTQDMKPYDEAMDWMTWWHLNKHSWLAMWFYNYAWLFTFQYLDTSPLMKIRCRNNDAIETMRFDYSCNSHKIVNSLLQTVSY